MSVLNYIQSPLKSASENGHSEIVAMLLKVKEIDVNCWVSILMPTSTTPPPCYTVANTWHYWCGMSVLFYLQSPLASASMSGHKEIVAMLLQVEGIDVNDGVCS